MIRVINQTASGKITQSNILPVDINPRLAISEAIVSYYDAGSAPDFIFNLLGTDSFKLLYEAPDLSAKNFWTLSFYFAPDGNVDMEFIQRFNENSYIVNSMTCENVEEFVRKVRELV